MQLSGRQTQFYIDVIYGAGFALGFGYLLMAGMNPLLVAFQGGLVLGYILRVWENMSIYERILQEEVAAEAEEAVATEAEAAVADRAETQVAQELEEQVPGEVTSEVEQQVERQMVEELTQEIKDRVGTELDERLDQEVEKRIAEAVQERRAVPPRAVSDSGEES